MALSVSFSASLYQLQSRDVPRVPCEQSLLRSSYLGKIEATLLAEYPPGRGWYPRPRGHVFTVSLGLVTLIGNINSSLFCNYVPLHGSRLTFELNPNLS